MYLYKRHTAGYPGMTSFTGKSGEAIVPGEALVLTGGYLTKCGATAVPQYIAQSGGTGTEIYVIPVENGDVFKAKFSVSATSIVPGVKLTLAANGTDVTATTTDGVATVLEVFGTAAGDECAITF